MASAATIDLRQLIRGLDIPLNQVQAVVELLDEGNTVPFITRYRKDRTGGLDEEQIREIQGRLTKARFLTERKQTILRSIEAQGKLTEKLAKQIQGATTTKRLEDLYLPYKPKKQTLATAARSRGLEPLAREILEADPLALNLDARAADFVNPDRQVPTAADALLGAGHILAEQISERAELRQRFRDILQRSGKLVSSPVTPDARTPAEPRTATHKGAADGVPAPDAQNEGPTDTHVVVEPVSAIDTTDIVDVPPVAEEPVASDEVTPVEEPVDVELEPVDVEETAEVEEPAETEQAVVETEESAIVEEEVAAEAQTGEPAPVEEAEAAAPTDASEVAPPAEPVLATEPIVVMAAGDVVTAEVVQPPASPEGKRSRQKGSKADQKATKAELKKKKEEQKQKAFSDYFDYREEIRKIPPHRILAINRGERARVLRVKIDADMDAMYAILDELVVPPEHPHADFLRGCARDAVTRLILPSLEREIRRELTEKAEAHAVGVFARNLRNLLLQPPIRDRRLLVIDPGFKSGCKLVAMDQFGTVLDHGVIYLIGKEDRRQEAGRKIIEMMTTHDLQVIVIGNGTACRETEDFIGNLIISTELAGRGAVYVIVNEAGASVYSTSRTGREEFPQYDASVRGAISIGRRLQDPLSELVKIDAANIGVGLYQHDVKAKHLSASLDEVVESCVNYVGVDVNTASPALLRYVSGLNQLTARRVYEHRRQNGPFRTREQLKDVPGFGEATFVQAAGFLKIVGGDNPLDATWIHPESYAVTLRLLEKVECSPSDLTDGAGAGKLAERTAKIDLAQMAQEQEVGLLTLKDILSQLARPGRDPREDLPKPVFKQGVLKLEDLTPGMELTGTILNVVDFGAFVDIGVHHSGLIHVSHLADKFIRDPHEVAAVGDIVKVWVLEVDKQRRRVSLTMVAPGTERTHGRRPAKPEENDQQQGSQQQQPQRQQRPPRPPRPGRGAEQGGRPAAGGGERRPPRHGDRQRGRGGATRPQFQQPPKPKKPLVPITDEMKAGKAPMRTFGDLLQFYELKQDTQRAEATAATPPAEEQVQASVETKPQETPQEPGREPSADQTSS
jgi:uncharacterized protein